MTFTRTHLAPLALMMLLLWGTVGIAPTHAVTAVDEDPDLYLALKAKVAYLEAVLASLQGGGTLDVAPTFTTGVRANTITLSGTLSRPTSTDMVEICGPMQKGSIDWGDGTLTGVAGLGCSGDVIEFESRHTYTTSGAYTITLQDMEERTSTRNVAVVVP